MLIKIYQTISKDTKAGLIIKKLNFLKIEFI